MCPPLGRRHRLPGDDGARRGGEAPPGLRHLPARRARPAGGDRATDLSAGADRRARRGGRRPDRGLARGAVGRRGLPGVLRPDERRGAWRAGGPGARESTGEGGRMIELLDDLEAGELSVEFEGQEPQDVLEWALERFAPRIAVSTAFQIDGVALIDMAYELDPSIEIFSVDTGRLPGETFELIERLRDRSPGLNLELLAPEPRQLQAMVARHGPNLFYRQVEKRL